MCVAQFLIAKREIEREREMSDRGEENIRRKNKRREGEDRTENGEM